MKLDALIKEFLAYSRSLPLSLVYDVPKFLVELDLVQLHVVGIESSSQEPISMLIITSWLNVVALDWIIDCFAVFAFVSAVLLDQVLLEFES